MLWMPQAKIKNIDNLGVVGGVLTGVTTSGTTLLDGTVTELISSGNNIQDSWGISIVICNSAGGGSPSETCMDILIGGATDDVLISALICGGGSPAGGPRYFFPLHIPQGKRIAAVAAGVVVSNTCRVGIALHGGGVPPFKVGSLVTTYGTQINNARGQSITPTASGGAASVTELTASTSRDHFAFMPGFQCSDSTQNQRAYSIGIGVGASTEDRIGTWYYGNDNDEAMYGPYPPMPVFQEVPAGSRLTMLAGNSGTNDAAYDGLIYAVS